jgi:cysteine-rich repeat protein
VIGDPLATALTISGGTLTQVDQIDGSNEFGFQATLQGTAVFVADDATTRVINAAQPGNLNLTSANVNLQGVMFPSYDGIASAPNRVYVSVNGELGAFDISDPFNPALQGTVSMTGGGGGPLRVTDDGNYVVNEAGGGVGIYDVSDATQPAYVTVAPIPQANVFSRNVATRGTFVYVTTSNGRVFTMDISDPNTPVDAANVNVGDTAATDVHPGQDYLYVLENGTVHLLADLPGYCDAVCGNGVMEYPELCDDGDLESGDECDADCTL